MSVNKLIGPSTNVIFVGSSWMSGVICTRETTHEELAFRPSELHAQKQKEHNQAVCFRHHKSDVRAMQP